MADGDRQPLLQEYEENSDTPQQKIKNLYSSKSVLGRNNTGLENGNAVVNLTKNKAVTCLLEEDNLVAIFVVAFDTKAGNVVEWSLPEDASLEGVEFKAMASGSHTLHKDFVYFRKNNYFGLACFENMPVESQVERGARMKSVGILCTSYTTLYRHMHFLEKQVEKLLERPGHYGHLKAFWADKKGMLPMNASTQSIRSVSSTSSYSAQILPEMKITHPAGCFSQFVKFFGEQTFVLWKFALLGKRILFFSPPPVGIVCYRVYCACSLACHSLSTAFNVAEPRPHFYVNVADIDALESEVSYVACTTEKIFETKPQLYDVYVDNQNVTTGQPVLRDLLKITAADKNKLQMLENQRAQMEFSNEMADELSEEDMYISYFREQNNRLLQTLLDVAHSQERQVTSDLMRTMGLDPADDRTFLMELVELYGINVMLMVDNPCCPR